ncbi:MAG TPA: hypothetical protein VFR37_02300 [Longimicrobium sp.]|nr:hypothetical protein [Longimicrobium sp.]
MPNSDDRPSTYQMRILRDAGCRVRPRNYESARNRIQGLGPSDGQVALLTELGLEIPASRKAASAAITAYETAHPEWAAARRAARSAKGRATRQERERAGQQTQHNETLLAYHRAGVERFGSAAASEASLSFLRALALQLPADSDERIATFVAMRGGLTGHDAGIRIDALRTPR